MELAARRDPELDHLYDDVIAPAIQAAGLEPKRVDRDNEGQLLKSEIVRFINNSEIVIADLTNERPNVYLEVGYTMGVDEFRHLILTSRRDHLPGQKGWDPNGPKVHFDLAGYDILLWDPDETEAFGVQLEQRIHHRLAVIAPSVSTVQAVFDEEWIAENREVSSEALAANDYVAFMQVSAALYAPKIVVGQQYLLDAAREAQIHTFGWPLGVVLEVEEYRPRPRVEGIAAEVLFTDGWNKSYDYWALRKNGDFFLRKSIFEDKRNPQQIFFNTRVVRATESVLYLLRLYGQLGVDPSTPFRMQLVHGGLKGRILGSSSGPGFLRPGVSTENEISTVFDGTLAEAESGLNDVVRSLVAPVFALFDFAEFDDEVYDDLIAKFVAGRR